MIPPGTFSAILARVSATRMFSSSLSRTHGPAMRKSLSAGKNSDTLFRRLYRRALAATSCRRLRLNRRGDEARKKRMRPRGSRLELGMKLTADEPRMRLQLHDLDQRAVWGESAEIQSVLNELIAVLVVHLVTVAVSLAHLRHSINRGGLSSDAQPAGICTEPHGAAHVGDMLLSLHERDHRISTVRCKLTGMTIRESHDVACELDDRRLHAETDSEKRESGFASITNGFEHSLDATNAESTRNQHGVEIREQLARFLATGEEVAGEPGYLHPYVVG